MSPDKVNSELMLFSKAKEEELSIALGLLKQAALFIKAKNINHWQQWLNPSLENVKWIRSGFENQEFHFVHYDNQLAGMFRIMNQDLKYWGQQTDKAFYLHSLVIKNEFKGLGLGELMIRKLLALAQSKGVNLVRLDCVGSNKRLCTYYEDLGFDLVKKQLMNERLHHYYQIKLA